MRRQKAYYRQQPPIRPGQKSRPLQAAARLDILAYTGGYGRLSDRLVSFHQLLGHQYLPLILKKNKPGTMGHYLNRHIGTDNSTYSASDTSCRFMYPGAEEALEINLLGH
jgi:hypothetical protein